MHEIIHVVNPETPSGEPRHGLEIEAVNDRPLAAGYYFVLWPTKARGSRSRGKRYFGPFASRAEARLLLTSAVALGLAENQHVTQAVTECRSAVRLARAANETKSPSPSWRRMAACAAC